MKWRAVKLPLRQTQDGAAKPIEPIRRLGVKVQAPVLARHQVIQVALSCIANVRPRNYLASLHGARVGCGGVS